MSLLLSPTAHDGVARCARYAFGPNRLHYCGPDASREMFAYLHEGASDEGLATILRALQTAYPYFEAIARANGIRDPFDSRVVDAYWIGNELLEHVPTQAFYRHLYDRLRLRDRYGPQEFDRLAHKLPQGARMHHSFHVLNAYKQTGKGVLFHDLASMDACRISWGKVTAIDGPTITLQRRPLTLNGHTLSLAEPEVFSVSRSLGADPSFDDLVVGQWITVHWNVPCEIVDDRAVRFLEYYTTKHLQLANTTL